MESVKSIVKDVVYGKSKIHTNMEFTFSNNIFACKVGNCIVNIPRKLYNYMQEDFNVNKTYSMSIRVRK